MATQIADLGKLPRIVTHAARSRKRRPSLQADHRFISPSYTRSYPLVAERARAEPSLKIRMEIAFSISAPALPWSPPVTVIPTSFARFKTRRHR